MYQFFVEPDNVNEEFVLIMGSDVNHITNVLRMKEGEHIRIVDGTGKEYECEITMLQKEAVQARILDITADSAELPIAVTLYQGLPKGDKMELIIQKAVELGAARIVPVNMKRSIVKLNEAKEKKKVERWNAIALSAAKQSKRSVVPNVCYPMSYGEMLNDTKELEALLLPYESATGMNGTRSVLASLKSKKSVGIIIGPEGGFDDNEVTKAKELGAQVITLGKRILRTETAGIVTMAMITLEVEENE